MLTRFQKRDAIKAADNMIRAMIRICFRGPSSSIVSQPLDPVNDVRLFPELQLIDVNQSIDDAPEGCNAIFQIITVDVLPEYHTLFQSKFIISYLNQFIRGKTF